MNSSQKYQDFHGHIAPERHMLPESVIACAQGVRRLFIKFSVQRPVLSMAFVILIAVMLLPLVTAATLMPVAMLLTYTGILASQGVFFITYNILIQGLLLAAIIIALFIVSFTLATSASVFHSYRIFRKRVSVKKTQ